MRMSMCLGVLCVRVCTFFVCSNVGLKRCLYFLKYMQIKLYLIDFPVPAQHGFLASL